MTDDATPSADSPEESTLQPVDENLCVALALLQHAHDCAQDARAAPWDFALEIGKLYEAGLTITDLRWLVVKRLVEHGSETSVYGDAHRSFTRSDGFNFLDTTCVVLTKKGAAFACRILQYSDASAEARQPTNSDEKARDEEAAPSSEIHSANGEAKLKATLKPVWNPVRRVLSLGGQIVKRFQVPARNQELILSVFQEEGWPEHIDDPLARLHDIDPKTRLNHVIYRLNGTQLKPLLRFQANGTGNGVCWSVRVLKPSRKRPSAARSLHPVA